MPARQPNICCALVVAVLCAFIGTCHAQVQSQKKTRNLKGPANEPWKCKPYKYKAGHLTGTTYTGWKCENVETVQQVYETVVQLRPSSEIWDGVNNVYGLAKSRSSSGTIIFLGTFDKVDQCEFACFRYVSGGTKCSSYTWHKPTFGSVEWRKQCFAVLEGRWSPQKQVGAVSGRVIRHSNVMQDANGRGCIGNCGGHGVCQNTTGICNCDTGFIGYDCSIEVACDSMANDGKCFTVFEKKLSWKKAEEKCAAGGGHLASLSSLEQQEVLVSVMGNCESVWLGLSDAREEGSFEWADGSRGSWVNWADNEPNNKGNEDYAVLRRAAKKWYDVGGKAGGATCFACSYREWQSSVHGDQDGACVRDCSGHGTCGALTGLCTCEEGYFGPDCGKRSPCEGDVINGRCYVVYGEEGDRDRAEAQCNARGGILAGVQSNELETALLEQARGRGCRSQEMWIGLNDEMQEGVWTWADREVDDTDYVNWLPWEPNNGALDVWGLSLHEEDGVILDKFGWTDVAVTRRNVSCFACEFEGAGEQEPADALSRLGDRTVDTPVLFNFFAPDLDPILRRVTCVPGSGVCHDDEADSSEAFHCAAWDPDAPPEEEEDEDEWEEVEEGEEEEEEEEGQEEEEGGESVAEEEEEEEEEEREKMPLAAAVEVPSGKCQVPLSLMEGTAARCWRTCREVLESFGEDAGDGCRQMCVRMAGQINEDMALVAGGDGAEVLEFYDGVNISDPAKVGSQGSEEEKQVRTEALVNNVWAAAVQVGQVEQAEKALLLLLRMHPHFPLLLFNLGVAMASQGRLQEAKQSYRRCAGNPRHRVPQCSANLGNILLLQGHLDSALQVLHAAAAQFPWYAPLHSGEAAARMRRGEFAKALAAARRAVNLKPGRVHYRLQAALAARRHGAMEEAVRVLGEGLAQQRGSDDDDAVLHEVMAELSVAALPADAGGLMEQYRVTLCTDRCEWQAGASLPTGTLPLLHPAALRAMRSLRLALRALRGRAASHALCMQTLQTEANLTSPLKCGRSPPAADLLRVRAAMADLWGRLGGWAAALDGHEAVLRERGSFTASLLGKARAAAELGDYIAVGTAMETAVMHGLRLASAPSSAKVVYGGALLELARGQMGDKAWRQAIPLLRAAVRVDTTRTLPYAVDAWRMLCKACMKANAPDAARFACRRVLRLSPHLTDAREALDWAEDAIKQVRKDREARERMRKQKEERERKESAQKADDKQDTWTWQFGDGTWRKGKGGGRGKSQDKGPRQHKAPRIPRGIYDKLDLDRTCTKAQIKRQYHKLALKYHPDKNPDKPETKVDERAVAQTKFREVSEAYKLLLEMHVDGQAGAAADDDDDAHCINC